ncbi:MAG: carboxypeptidase-like regulatory domain-containing protein [Maribacter sp.]|nr:carboxypeptidase-like regulatory domain-containing protein [Maribacter sp.]
MSFSIPKNGIVLLLFHVLFLSSLCAQQDFIRGKLLDAKTGEPVVFATIKVKGKAKGVISNQDGGFRVPKKFKDLGDVLVISSMGYEKREIPISGLSPEHINSIRLRPGIIVLNEAVVSAKKKRPLSASEIVRRSIKAIPLNYPQYPFSTIGYYRDYQIKKNDYINLNEAILEVFDKGFAHNDNTTSKISIYDYQKNNDFPRDTMAQKPYDYLNRNKVIDNAFLPDYGGNEFTILRIHDALRNYNINSFSWVNQFDTDLLQNHKFSKEEDSFLEDEYLHTISFEYLHPIAYKKSEKYYRAYGKLYISKKNYAIHKMEYSLYDYKTFAYSDQYENENEGSLLLDLKVEYRPNKGKMYLSYISFKNRFRSLQTPKFKIEKVTVDFGKRCFVVKFNTNFNKEKAGKPRHYKVRINGRRINFKYIVLQKDQVILYPDLKDDDELFEELYAESRAKGVDSDLIKLSVKGLEDEKGNKINESEIADYNQFREFFVQQVKPNNPVPKDHLFMKKNHPIFEDQPILKPDNFTDYWMNTPLQNSKE